LLEGRAAAKPAVAMNVGGVGEVLDEGVDGFLIEPANYEQFAQRVRWLIDGPDLRETMGMRSREKYLAHFTLERMVDRYTALSG
jgi:glycosyltransferase involved in cell wall biosynthesis